MNADVISLQKKRANIANDMASIVEGAEKEDRGITDEERSKFDAMRVDYDDTKKRIDDLIEAEELRKSINEPSNPLPVENVKYHDFGVQERSGKSEDAEQEQHDADYHAAFNKMIRSCEPGLLELDVEQQKILRSNFVAEKRAQSIGTLSAGGYLVPSSMSGEIVERMKAFGGIRGAANVINTSTGESINYPTNDDTGNEGELVAENAQVTELDFVFGQTVLSAYKYSSKVVRVSVELLQDNAFNLESFISRKFGERLGRITGKHFATGTGDGQPHGLLNAATVGLTSTSGSDITYADLLSLKHSVDPSYRNSASCRFVFNDATLLKLKQMVDSEGRPLWKPSLTDGTPELIDGDQFVIDQGVADAAAGAKPIAYGDLNEYVIRDVLGFTLHRLVEKYIDYGQIGFLAFMRTDADLMDNQAVKSLQMAAGRSTASTK